MNQNIDRLIDLVKKTGDKLIVVCKEDSESAWVLMSLSDYEKLVPNKGKIARKEEDLTILKQQDKIEEINQNIAILQEEEKKEVLNEAMRMVDEEAEGQFYFEPIE